MSLAKKMIQGGVSRTSNPLADGEMTVQKKGRNATAFPDVHLDPVVEKETRQHFVLQQRTFKVDSIAYEESRMEGASSLKRAIACI